MWRLKEDQLLAYGHSSNNVGAKVTIEILQLANF